MILLYTDFGCSGPYVGQMEIALRTAASAVPVVNLMSDAPAFAPAAAAHLLAALSLHMPTDAVVVGVVDPGVGTERLPVVLEADGRRFVGPGNGLFEVVAARASEAKWWQITWRPDGMSASFHGRDLFAPVAARLARREPVPGEPLTPALPAGVGDDTAQVIYVDTYGNAMTGIRAARLPTHARLRVAGRTLPRARTFGEVDEGGAFCYENSLGLLEVAVNRGSAAAVLGIGVGTAVEVV